MALAVGSCCFGATCSSLAVSGLNTFFVALSNPLIGDCCSVVAYPEESASQTMVPKQQILC